MELKQATDPQYWQNLLPNLKFSAETRATNSAPLPLELSDQTHDQLIEEGYLQFNRAMPTDLTQKLKNAVETLHELGWHPLFVFVYDEIWELSSSLSPLLGFALASSPLMLPDFWIWYVDPTKEQAGWAPHRDKGLESIKTDGSPKSATVWIALSDVDPLNGCMYAVPANRDSGYWDPAGPAPESLQAVRALPAPAGSVFLWNQNVYHWGAQSSKRASHPRISVAFEYQSADIPPFNTPLLSLGQLPSFTERLRLIGKQILQYRHMYNYSDQLVSLATSLTSGGAPIPIETIAAMGTSSGVIGRNSPCPCGSQKRYKHCHGKDD